MANKEMTFNELHDEIRQRIGAFTIDLVTRYADVIDEDGDYPANMITAGCMTEAGAVLTAGILMEDGASTGRVIEGTLAIVAKQVSRAIQVVTGVEIETETINAMDAESLNAAAKHAKRQKPSEHNAKVAAEILAECEVHH